MNELNPASKLTYDTFKHIQSMLGSRDDLKAFELASKHFNQQSTSELQESIKLNYPKKIRRCQRQLKAEGINKPTKEQAALRLLGEIKFYSKEVKDLNDLQEKMQALQQRQTDCIKNEERCLINLFLEIFPQADEEFGTSLRDPQVLDTQKIARIRELLSKNEIKSRLSSTSVTVHSSHCPVISREMCLILKKLDQVNLVEDYHYAFHIHPAIKSCPVAYVELEKNNYNNLPKGFKQIDSLELFYRHKGAIYPAKRSLNNRVATSQDKIKDLFKRAIPYMAGGIAIGALIVKPELLVPIAFSAVIVSYGNQKFSKAI